MYVCVCVYVCMYVCMTFTLFMTDVCDKERGIDTGGLGHRQKQKGSQAGSVKVEEMNIQRKGDYRRLS